MIQTIKESKLPAWEGIRIVDNYSGNPLILKILIQTVKYIKNHLNFILSGSTLSNRKLSAITLANTGAATFPP